MCRVRKRYIVECIIVIKIKIIKIRRVIIIFMWNII